MVVEAALLSARYGAALGTLARIELPLISAPILREIRKLLASFFVTWLLGYASTVLPHRHMSW
jgi:hypothetical protein